MTATVLPIQSSHGVLLVLFVVALITPHLAGLARAPPIIGLIVGGMVIGPDGLGVIDRGGAVGLLGGAGLLYLLFQAGLDLDHEDFRAHRVRALGFGALTFAIPFLVGTLVHRALGFSLLASLLLGTCWASHTPLTYPVFQRAGLVANRAVAVAVGGTIIADTAALLGLVALARAHEGDLSLEFAVVQLPVLAMATFVIVAVLPRVAAWFFAGLGQDRAARFLFVMISLFGSALLADTAGVEPIIGAFLAGLSLNRLVVEESDLATQVEFFGSMLLIPIFLVSVGMLLDPVGALTDGRTIAHAAAFVTVVLVGKGLAAMATARINDFDRSEMATLFSLSVPQAAATLAAVVVGFDIGLLDQSTVNAAVMVILVSCVVGSIVAGRAADRLPHPPARISRLGKRILVPLPEHSPPGSVIEVAAALAGRDSGTVLPLAVLDHGASPADVRDLRNSIVSTIERTALANGSEARTVVRLDLTPTAGTLHAAIEHEATAIVVAWDGRHRIDSRFGHEIGALVEIAPVPVIICRATDLRAVDRIVLFLTTEQLGAEHRAETQAAWAIAHLLGERRRLPLALVSTAERSALEALLDLRAHRGEDRLGVSDPGALLDSVLRPSDLVVTPVATPAIDLVRDTALVAVRFPRSANHRSLEPTTTRQVPAAIVPPSPMTTARRRSRAPRPHRPTRPR